MSIYDPIEQANKDIAYASYLLEKAEWEQRCGTCAYYERPPDDMDAGYGWCKRYGDFVRANDIPALECCEFWEER